MKDISNIFERIEWISREYGYKSINDFAVNGLGYSASEKINRLKDGTKKPSVDIIIDISKKFEDININWLLFGVEPKIYKKYHNETGTKSGTFSDKTKNIENVPLVSDVTIGYNRSIPAVVTVDNHGCDNIVLVSVKAQAGYLSGYGDPEYIEKLPVFSLPNINNGTFRMFQVDGLSMYPTILNNSYVVGEWVENWITGIKDNRIYIVVCDEGVLIKRVLNRIKKYGNLYLKSDNRKEYPNISLEPTQIYEVWEVKMHLSFDLPDPTVLYDRVSDLEAEIQHIKGLLKAKN